MGGACDSRCPVGGGEEAGCLVEGEKGAEKAWCGRVEAAEGRAVQVVGSPVLSGRRSLNDCPLLGSQ
jgi:hypothetical protein